MPTTNIEGPNANIAAGTIDGVTYGALGQPQRIHESVTGASAAFGTTALKGSLYDNCFNLTQIPSDATITGIELVAGVDFDGSGNSNFGNFGSTGASESATFKMYFHNGTDYSAALTFLSTPSGGSLNGDSTELTLTGGNKRYLGLSTLGILAGANDSLSGLSFDPADQADFGFAIVCSAISDTPVYGITRGIGLRATYTEAVIVPPPTYNNRANFISTASGNINITTGKITI
jgi:hypothetical protein|tara:strand:- start:43 stop:741 length:699 start_codon:yes stop_codon:yes gene_type:complete